jgi:hypothetical protein
VLSPARWLLKANDLHPVDADTAAWDPTLSTWRDRWRVPSTVVLCERELRLPLDLDDWYYGTPGIATGDAARQQIAEHALAACLSDTAQLSRIIDNSLCHGWAGLYQPACAPPTTR